MNEELWLSGDDPMAMLGAVHSRLSARKLNFLAYSSARPLLAALPPEPFAEALDWWEWNWQRSLWNESHWEKHDDYRARCRAVWQANRTYRIRKLSRLFPADAFQDFPGDSLPRSERMIPRRYFDTARDLAEQALAFWNLQPNEFPLYKLMAQNRSVNHLLDPKHHGNAVSAILETLLIQEIAVRVAAELDSYAFQLKPGSLRLEEVRNEIAEKQEQLDRELADDSHTRKLRATYAAMIREQFGNPYRACPFDPRWRTDTVLRLAAGIERDRAFDRIPILADALIEAGCDNDPLLIHLTHPGEHQRGCWVLDRILEREPEFEPLVNVTGRHGRGHPPEES
jgi:hypothetical protein